MRIVTGKRGFTVVEMLAVIAVIAVLASLLLPVAARAKAKAQTVHCMAQLRQLGLAMTLYGDDHQGLLPAAHAEVTWTHLNPPPWTRPLLSYYETTNLLRCPAYSRVHQRSPFSYFMGGRAAFIEAGGQPASVPLPRISFPSQYLLSGDCNYPFAPADADPDNYTAVTLFATNPPAHGGRVNVLFADKHVVTARRFDPRAMTYSFTTPGMDWNDWDF
jgi:prepilin-type N-terminal cleavage/methylation domain-containing protein/prepilin-type processing-associated H-X9-DG protein